ncbi:MAG TPA: aliphatic sulfonate ABC transporter substrate-binding protein [Chthoniobacterales bacterium]
MKTTTSRRRKNRVLWLVVFALCLWVDRGSSEDRVDTIKLDWAYYNPVSLVLKKKGLLEKEFEKDGIKIEWIQSLGSNKALELLRSKSLDFGSTAGAAALLGRANGNPIKAIYVYSNPEWTALVTRPNSGIQQIQDLKGKRVAVTRGTDPHIFLLRALNRVGLTEKDIELVPLQHPDGKTALEKGSVDAWAGLDPYTAQLEVEKGYLLFFRNKKWNSYGILNVRESFAKDHPELVKRVLAVYEQARLWTLDHQSEARQILAGEAKLTDAVASKVWDRTDLTNSAIGPVERETIRASGDILKQSQVIDPGAEIDRVVADLIDPEFFPSQVSAK